MKGGGGNLPISEAAIAGIGANGHGWRRQIKLADLTNQLGGEPHLTAEAIESIRDRVVARCRTFLDTLPAGDAERDDVEKAVDDLEMVDSDLEEVRGALSVLYDQFDYWRIVAVA
jgi:hypothetical protein